jgi:methionine biosynthesis protein MetW
MSTVKFEDNGIRFDLQIVASWIEPGSKVLDLGCGEGDLLYFLQENKRVFGTGIERAEGKVSHCIERGLSVVQGDINKEIRDYADDTFDYVIVSQTLQQVYEPARLIQRLLRIGKRGIVSFPSFGHWRIRLQLLTKGLAPITKQLPYEWHNTPNIRVVTIRDFREFSRQVGFEIFKEAAVSTDVHNSCGNIVRFLPNLLASYGIFLIGRREAPSYIK